MRVAVVPARRLLARRRAEAERCRAYELHRQPRPHERRAVLRGQSRPRLPGKL
jgi:hypothetical protein